MLTIIRKALIVLAILLYTSSNTFASPLQKAEAAMGKWVWLPKNNMRCRDGSSTGIGVRLQPSTKAVMIYLQGGGACYDADSCTKNSKAGIAGEKYSKTHFNNWVITLGNQGIFNTRNNSNPVAGWNHIYIP